MDTPESVDQKAAPPSFLKLATLLTVNTTSPFQRDASLKAPARVRLCCTGSVDTNSGLLRHYVFSAMRGTTFPR